MDCKQVLAGQIVDAALVYGANGEALQLKVLELLRQYKVEPATTSGKENLEKLMQRFIAAKRIEGLSARTLGTYRLYLAKFAQLVPKAAGRIAADDIRDFVAGLQVKESSLQTILAILRSFFGWLTREELIRKNPMNKIPTPKTAKKKLRRALSVESLERLRNACTTAREKALVEVLYSTGCRVSELCGVLLQDVDFASRCVRVKGKGGSERLVYFSIKACLLLQEYLHQRPEGKALFCNARTPYGPMSARSVEKIVKALGERAALQEGVYPHKLRHTMATLSLNAGMSITAIQKLLGHRQLSTTQIYASISMENVRHEHERFVS